jgi:hypothetical protein
MAKRAGSVSSVVRAYLAEHPEAKTGEVAAAVSKQMGKEVKSNYVSMIKSQSKKAGGKKRGRKKGVKMTGGASGESRAPSNGSIGILKSASAFVKECGGLKEAMGVLGELQIIIGVSN